MAIITFTIGTAGRTYSTWAAAIAALPANIVTSGNSYVLEAYNDSEFVASGVPVISLAGLTTDSTHFITLTTGPGQSFRDTVGNALNYNQVNGVGLRSDSHVIECTVPWTVISKLQTKSTANSGAVFAIECNADDIEIQNCICVCNSDAGSAARLRYSTNVHDALVTNSVFIQQNGVMPTTSVVQGYTVRMHFCTIVAPSDAQVPTAAFHLFNAQPATIANCALFGSAAVLTGSSSATVTYSNCMTDIVSVPTGVTGSQTYTNQFVGITSATGNWRVKAGANLIGAGAFNALYPSDIFGVARPGSPTIGAMEFAAAAAADNPPFINRARNASLAAAARPKTAWTMVLGTGMVPLSAPSPDEVRYNPLPLWGPLLAQ